MKRQIAGVLFTEYQASLALTPRQLLDKVTRDTLYFSYYPESVASKNNLSASAVALCAKVAEGQRTTRLAARLLMWSGVISFLGGMVGGFAYYVWKVAEWFSRKKMVTRQAAQILALVFSLFFLIYSSRLLLTGKSWFAEASEAVSDIEELTREVYGSLVALSNAFYELQRNAQPGRQVEQLEYIEMKSADLLQRLKKWPRRKYSQIIVFDNSIVLEPMMEICHWLEGISEQSAILPQNDGEWKMLTAQRDRLFETIFAILDDYYRQTVPHLRAFSRNLIADFNPAAVQAYASDAPLISGENQLYEGFGRRLYQLFTKNAEMPENESKRDIIYPSYP